ncbi:MAG: IPTL-CTERM sorting domain-containing protein [Thermoanaerobaculia bacterium]|nr:IPTL-CTERM sorting domain-containing protein [Thermoanaerobaculia bacterium]
MQVSLKRSPHILCVLGLAMIFAGPVSAQWIAGASLTVDNVDPGLLQVDVTGSIFYTTGVTFGTAFVGVDSGFGQIAPAISWGDGSSIAPYWPTGNGIPFDQVSTPPGAPGPVRAYRMAFSHTYGAAGNYDVRINSHFTGGISPAIVFTGTTTTAQTPTYSVYGYVQTFLRNTAAVNLGGGTGSLEDIPTMSEIGMLALALMLGLTGMFLLRR